MSKYRPKQSQTQPNNEPELDYTALGVVPPTREEHGTEDDIADVFAGQKATHKWIQQGPTLICIGCPWEHATEPRFVDYILQGTDSQGLPILKRVANMQV